ncbi:eIF4E-associated protein Eap1 [Schizosaccharomyces osmophilus]|uniref:EIF4E-associated protein Eap1 n=1 Tax=Schizosaccharomyces osmophilus TaxID=2545709 RepID=A0AAE9WIL4_9SCHI|nr:eIF4E-associated protein Eap1 [Schizosaccharomyces osmophilus]WBW75306.1 eIF4E-associated protein Eap1 [Schizosaccharomyces osmophilus]
MSQVIQYSEADLLYLSKSPLIKKPENLPEWILPEAMKADRERHIRQEKEMKNKHDDEGRQIQSDRKYAKSKHEDIILGPPKLSFASSNENGRSIGRHEDLLSLGNVYNGSASVRHRNGMPGHASSKNAPLNNMGSTSSAWTSLNKHGRKKDFDRRDDNEGLERLSKQRAGANATSPMIPNTTEEFEVWKRMMKANSAEAPITSGMPAVAHVASQKPVPSISRAASGSGSSFSARANVSVDSLFGKRPAVPSVASVAPPVGTPVGTPPRFASPALGLETAAHVAPSTTSSRFSKFFNGLGGPETSKQSTPSVSRTASPKVNNAPAAPSAIHDKDAEGFQRVLAMLGRQTSSASASPKVPMAQSSATSNSPGINHANPGAMFTMSSLASPAASVAPPPGLSSHALSTEDASFFRSLIHSDARPAVPPPPGFSTNNVGSPDENVSNPLPGLYNHYPMGPAPPMSSVPAPAPPPGFGFQQPPLPYSPGFSPSMYGHPRMSGHPLPDLSKTTH